MSGKLMMKKKSVVFSDSVPPPIQCTVLQWSHFFEGNLKKDTTDIRELETHFESREYFSDISKRGLGVLWVTSMFRSYNPLTSCSHTFLHGRVLTDFIDTHIYLWE